MEITVPSDKEIFEILTGNFGLMDRARKDKIFGEFSLIIGSEIWYMLTVGIVLTTDSVDWLC